MPGVQGRPPLSWTWGTAQEQVAQGWPRRRLGGRWPVETSRGARSWGLRCAWGAVWDPSERSGQ